MKKILLLFALFLTFSLGAQDKKDVREMQKLNQFMTYLTGTYVDNLNTGELVEGAIVEILSKLDPHSAYVSQEEMKGVRESFDANFEGIGIEFNILNDTLIVVNTIPGGPSEKVGLQPNDRIIMVGDSSIIGIKQMDVPKLLRGPKGTVVDIVVFRHGVATPLKFRIIRDKIPIYTVDASYKVNDKTGYVRINRFAATTNNELQKAIKSMKGIDALILDLRGNGGGYLDQAVDVANNFLKKGSLIVSTEGRIVPEERLVATQDPIFEKGKLIVLVDEFSASASEIVAGAIQDWDRGTIIGRRTFGKGLVQRQFPLIDGSAVRITVARYHTPSGRVIQRPYEQGDAKKYSEDFINRFKSDTVQKVASDTLAYKTLIKGRTVYGGGGINPDITVERDTTSYSDYWSKVIRAGVFNDFVIDYMDKNRTNLEKDYPTIKKFDNEFIVDKIVMLSIMEMARKRDIECSDPEIERVNSSIRLQLKALIAQKLWDTSGYFEIENKEDKVFLRALEELKVK